MVSENNSELDKLKDLFIVDAKSYDMNRLTDQLKILIKYSVVDKNGKVWIKGKNLTTKGKVILVLTARFLANKLDGQIPAGATTEEIEEMTGIDKLQTSARLHDAVVEGYAVNLARGTFQIRPVKIDEFLNGLEGKGV